LNKTDECAEDVYRPRDDSYLLAKWVKKLVSGNVLDMGTGSGFQAVIAARKPNVNHVLAVDINLNALNEAKKRVRKNNLEGKISVKKSNLFENISEKFNWIIFNPPYLSAETSIEINEKSWAGGKIGSELISRFLNEAKHYLIENGSILLIYSSLTSLNNEYSTDYEVKLLERRQIFFEDLYCVLFKSNPS
jgi:release factor glutamine methyltransferase